MIKGGSIKVWQWPSDLVCDLYALNICIWIFIAEDGDIVFKKKGISSIVQPFP